MLVSYRIASENVGRKDVMHKMKSVSEGSSLFEETVVKGLQA
jgi:hypothetical protein